MELNMKLQQVLSYVRKAADDYSMIKEGDSIAVGISGEEGQRGCSGPCADQKGKGI